MKELIESKWQEILNILVKEHEISEVAVNTWIQPLIIQTITDDSITFFMVRGPRGIEFIKHKYYDIYLSMAIEQVTGKQFKILFTDSNSAAPKSEPKKVSVPAEYIGNLNPRYTFDTFVVGPTNKMAHAVSVAVAESPGGAYNPLFLYGGAGLGKTHLMHSIAHHIINNRPDLRVLYVTSEKFTNELIDSLKHDKNKEFRDKYTGSDCCLQFIPKYRSQDKKHHHAAASTDKSTDKSDTDTAYDRLDGTLLCGYPLHGLFGCHNRANNKFDTKQKCHKDRKISHCGRWYKA